ncbi:SagB/ThcOx family dehydrogenase [Viscerimonas tarda]
MRHLFLILCFCISALCVQAQQDVIKLPAPTKTGGKPLMEVLNARQSIRAYSGKSIDNQTLSNLLWAANGFNRPGMRTVPSANNKQEVDVYVMFKTGIYFYDAKENKLTLKVKGDFIKSLGGQDFVKDAAVNLIYVANLDKSGAGQIDTGYISQNVYLFCASAGLGTVARGSFDKALATDMKLTDKQQITLVQPVGVPK